MLLRWLFWFLILTNLLLLLWYSSFVTEQGAPSVSDAKVLNNIRLLSEIDSGALNLKTGQAEVIQEPDVCNHFAGFAQSQSAEWLLSTVRADGFVAEAATERFSENVYVIKVEISDSDNTRQALVEYLRENRGLEIDALELEPGVLYVLGRYDDRVEAESELQEVVISGVAAYLVLEQIEDTQYNVVVYEEGGRKLSSEIKELVAQRYSEVKITKKVCERVASH